MRTWFGIGVAAVVCVGCGGSFPAPTQRMADAQAAERSAREVGADNQPAARLHLKLAEEAIVLAQRAIDAGDNERADALLVRAKADAELALALTRELIAKGEAQRAIDQLNSMRSANAMQGAQP